MKKKTAECEAAGQFRFFYRPVSPISEKKAVDSISRIKPFTDTPVSVSAIRHFSVLLPFPGVPSPSRVSLRETRRSGRQAAQLPPPDGVCEEPQKGPRTPAQPEVSRGGQGVPLTSSGQWHLASMSNFVALVRKTSKSCLLLLPNFIIIPFPLPSHLNPGIIFSILY